MKPKSRFASLAFMALSLLTLSLTLLPDSPAFAAKHPGLVFEASDVPTLRKRLAGPLKPVAQSLRAGIELAYEPKNDYPQTPDPRNQWYKQDIRALADTIGSYAFAAVAFRDGGRTRSFRN